MYNKNLNKMTQEQLRMQMMLMIFDLTRVLMFYRTQKILHTLDAYSHLI